MYSIRSKNKRCAVMHRPAPLLTVIWSQGANQSQGWRGAAVPERFHPVTAPGGNLLETQTYKEASAAETESKTVLEEVALCRWPEFGSAALTCLARHLLSLPHERRLRNSSPPH